MSNIIIPVENPMNFKATFKIDNNATKIIVDIVLSNISNNVWRNVWRNVTVRNIIHLKNKKFTYEVSNEELEQAYDKVTLCPLI